jgi:hypothetical protein
VGIRRASESRALEVTPTRIVWAGRTDPDPDAPIVECELAVPVDPARMPVPSTLLGELVAQVRARRPTERGVTRIGAAVINPRDDWPEIGIEVDQDFLALDGTYGGSTGQLSEVALRVGAGAIATFVRCDLRTGCGGSIAARDATILLIDCRLPAVEWELGSHCHLVILGGEIPGQLRVLTTPTATVTVDGLLERRVSNVSLITNAPHGIPIVVDGVTYGWERDDLSGGVRYTRGDSRAGYIHITSEGRKTISFELPDRRITLPRWWRRFDVTPPVIERAVRIAARTGATLLNADEVEEAFAGHGHTLQEELIAARAALDGLTRPDPHNTREVFIHSLVAIGCADQTAEARTAIDDWVASHADALRSARAGLQELSDERRDFENIFTKRSAIAFLLELCARMNVDLEIDTRLADERIAPYGPRVRNLPLGIPASHTWWGTLDPPPQPPVPDDDLPGPMR